MHIITVGIFLCSPPLGKQPKIGLYKYQLSIFLTEDTWASKLETNSIFGRQEKVALGVARFSGRGYSRLPPFFGRLGLPDGFAYYMEGRWQG